MAPGPHPADDQDRQSAVEQPAHEIEAADDRLPAPDPDLLDPVTPLDPEFEPGPVRTQAVYRQLTGRGLGSSEAANLTAFLAGLHVHRSAWTVRQINGLMFLRELYLGQAWGDAERHAA